MKDWLRVVLLEIILSQSSVPVVIDAGLISGSSHAADAMEMGADAVLVNTAIAMAGDPVAMVGAFKMSVESGWIIFESGQGGGVRRGRGVVSANGFS